MQEIKVTAELRDKAGVKGALSQIRADKKIPAVIYGGKKEPIAISISEKDLADVLKGGANVIVNIATPNGVENAIIKEIQYHVVKDTANHIDFLRVNMNEKIEVVVPVKLSGTCEAVKTMGALINQVLREVHIRCLPSKIPHELFADISAMTINKPIFISDLNLDKDIEVIGGADRAIVHLMIPKEEEVAAAPVAGAAAVQPESSSTKGKKDEEGKVVAKPAAGAAPAAKK